MISTIDKGDVTVVVVQVLVVITIMAGEMPMWEDEVGILVEM